jgi:uncharacterized protein (TIGR03437 family)
VAESVAVTISGVNAPVDYAGAIGLVGLDQINIRIPASLPAGPHTVILSANNGGTLVPANAVTITLQ